LEFGVKRYKLIKSMIKWRPYGTAKRSDKPLKKNSLIFIKKK